MTDLQETVNLAQKLQWASPVNSTQPTQQANLSSSYLNSATWDNKSNAFLTDATIENQISSVTSTSNEAEAQAKSIGIDLSAYNPSAEAKARELAAVTTKKQEEDQRLKAKAEQREKIAQFLKWQSAKDRRLWYYRWVFAGVFLTLWVAVVSTILFKQNIISFLENDLDNYLVNWSSITTKLLCDNIEIKLPENLQLTDNETVNNLANLENLLTFGWTVMSHYSTKVLSHIPTIGEAQASEIVFAQRPQEDIAEEPVIKQPKYTFINVESVEEANRVMSENCSELSCWYYANQQPEDIVLCKQFRLKEDLDEHTARIGSSWSCRYKNSSELWYLSRE